MHSENLTIDPRIAMHRFIIATLFLGVDAVCRSRLMSFEADNILGLMSFWKWGLLQSMLFWGWSQFKLMPFWGWGLLQLMAFWNWWRFEVDISWCSCHLRLFTIDAYWSCWFLFAFQGWWRLQSPFLGGWSHLQLEAFWGWCCLVSPQHPGIWTTPFSQMDRSGDVWSGKSSHFLSSILPSPSPSLLPSHPTISGSLLGILCLIPLSFLATSD